MYPFKYECYTNYEINEIGTYKVDYSRDHQGTLDDIFVRVTTPA